MLQRGARDTRPPLPPRDPGDQGWLASGNLFATHFILQGPILHCSRSRGPKHPGPHCPAAVTASSPPPLACGDSVLPLGVCHRRAGGPQGPPPTVGPGLQTTASTPSLSRGDKAGWSPYTRHGGLVPQAGTGSGSDRLRLRGFRLYLSPFSRRPANLGVLLLSRRCSRQTLQSSLCVPLRLSFCTLKCFLNIVHVSVWSVNRSSLSQALCCELSLCGALCQSLSGLVRGRGGRREREGEQ